MTTTETPSHIDRTRWSAVVAVGTAIILAALDMTIVAVALPSIGVDLAAPPAVTQWVMLAYFLPMVALGIPVGRWLDRAEVRVAFGLAVAGFGLASVLVMVSPTLWALLASRAVQGVFAAVIGVMGFPIVATTVRPEHRARAMGLILTLIPLASVAGPGLGGLLTTSYGWRSVFAINIPVALVAFWLGRRAIPVGSPGRPALPLPDRRALGEALVLGIAVAALLLGVDALAREPTNLAVPAALIAVAALAAAAWVRHPVSRPVVTFVRRPELGLQVGAMLLMTTGMGATYFLVPYFFADVLHRSASSAGLVLLVLAAAMAATSPIAGAVADRIGPSPLLLAGAAVTLAGMLALALLGADPHAADVAWRLALVGVGQGLFAGPNSAAILAATPGEMTGTAGGVTALFRTLGFTLGPAVGALSWSLTGGGATAFHAGALVMTAVSAAALAVTLLARVARRPLLR